ncbi:MAG: protein kinase [Elusimicrobia bacterium]|nr:protein kinase [Elusimicrobiota bacterium]
MTPSPLLASIAASLCLALPAAALMQGGELGGTPGGGGGISQSHVQEQAVLNGLGGPKTFKEKIAHLQTLTDPAAKANALHELGNLIQTNTSLFAARNGLSQEQANAITARLLHRLGPQGITPVPQGDPGGEVGSGPGQGNIGLAGGLHATAPVLKAQDASAAEDMGRLMMQTQPASPVGPAWVGDAAAAKKDDAGAFASWSKAVDLGAPPEVRLKRGVVADRLGDHELAHADAKALLKLDPSDKAAESLYMLTRSRPSKVRLLDASALAADDGRLAAAGAAPATPRFDGRSTAAPGAFAPERTAESIAAQENAAINGREVTAQSAKLTEDAKLALRVKDVAKALRLSQEAIKADPSNADARSVRAAAFLQGRRYDLAVQEASAGLALVPDSAPLLYTRAVAYGRQKLWQEAFQDADQAVRSSPNSAYVYRGRAAANWGLKKREAMLEDLRAAARIDRRYAEDIKRAIEGPEDVDPTLLFGDLGSEPSRAAPAASSHAPRYALWAAGLVLAVLGMLPVLFPSVRRHVTTVLRRGPAVADGEAAGDGLPASGFWRRYEVMREIGAGGMGVVYEAWDKNLERRVAVKRMRDEIRQDRRERERFLQEARTVAQMRHPNLVEIYSIEEDGDDAYLVFEFVEGKTLHEHISDKGRLSPAEARDVFRGLCAGVDYAHRRGVVHRDLKPANVIVETDGTVKVMDFGVARAVDVLARQQMTNTVIGTPPYMAPEQEQGVVCAQSDVYALGVCLYEALCGVLPFQGTAGAVLLAKMQAKYEPLENRTPGLPPAIYSLVDRALDPKPEARVQSAAELYKELEAAVGVPA